MIVIADDAVALEDGGGGGEDAHSTPDVQRVIGEMPFQCVMDGIRGMAVEPFVFRRWLYSCGAGRSQRDRQRVQWLRQRYASA